LVTSCPLRVDAESTLTTTLRKELHTDPAVCALDEKLAELPEVFLGVNSI